MNHQQRVKQILLSKLERYLQNNQLDLRILIPRTYFFYIQALIVVKEFPNFVICFSQNNTEYLDFPFQELHIRISHDGRIEFFGDREKIREIFEL